MVDIVPGAAPFRAVQSSPPVERTVQAVPSAVEAQQQKSVPVASEVSPAGQDKSEAVSRPAASVSDSSNIVTFRDGETGRLVIKLVGSRNNEVLAEFPSPNQLSRYPTVRDNLEAKPTVDAKA
ncbi:hypothetical protein [Kiloniella sp. b19]|uniref:hypothetical protein n=1 Tax=Kiloniella sp. GXU_MW_B19 TaxID=3141326 RepID=UPI0031DC519F